MAIVSCPVGGFSYTCATTNPTFLGCCDINPCYNGNCPPVSLYPMGLGDNYTYVPGHSCPNGGQWWTCTDQKPTFQGCCATDPCDGIGCPTLIAAGLDTDTSQTVPAAVASPSDLESSIAAGQSPACIRRSSGSFSPSTTYDSAFTRSLLTNLGHGGNKIAMTPAVHHHHMTQSSGTGSVRGGTAAGVAILLLTGALIIFSCAGLTG